MGKALIASVVGNLMLVITAFFLFNTNSKLNVQSGEQAASLAGERKNVAMYKERETQCVAAQKTLVIEHRKEIDALQAMASNAAKANAARIEALTMERGRVEALIRGIKPPVKGSNAEERLENINKMIDGYITELRQ